MAKAAGDRGHFEILVNNAGVAGPTAPLGDITLEEWNETVAVNLTGVFLACKAALPYLSVLEHGKIVNIGSVTGKQPLLNRTPYAAAKLGVVGLTRTLAHEVGPYGISVNVISPWLVEGARLEDGRRIDVERARAHARRVARRDDRGHRIQANGERRGRRRDTLFSSVRRAANNLTGQDINVAAGAVMY